MPEMQEHFPAMARDGRYAGNAGAFSGDGRYAGPPVLPAPAGTSHFLWGGNAGAISGEMRSALALRERQHHYLGDIAVARALRERDHRRMRPFDVGRQRHIDIVVFERSGESTHDMIVPQ